MKNTNVSFGKRIQMIWKEFSNNLKKRYQKELLGSNRKVQKYLKMQMKACLLRKKLVDICIWIVIFVAACYMAEAYILHHCIARKRSKCKWTLRLSRCFHLALLLNSISQSCVLLLSQINCWCSDPRNWILTFLSVSCESSKGRRRHGRSKRIWVKCFGRSLCWFLSSCNFSETGGSKINRIYCFYV